MGIVTQNDPIFSRLYVARDYGTLVTWTGVIETFNEAGNINFGGAIRYDANTLFRCTFTKSTAFRTGYNFWSIHRIEEFHENGKDIRELSSIKPSIDNNILIPVSGQTLLKQTVTVGANTVVTECLIDYTKLDKNKTYKLSARLDDGKDMVLGGLLRITEESETRILETTLEEREIN